MEAQRSQETAPSRIADSAHGAGRLSEDLLVVVFSLELFTPPPCVMTMERPFGVTNPNTDHGTEHTICSARHGHEAPLA